MAQYPASIALSSLNGANGFKLSGEAANDRSGASVASAGDVNGDGFAGLIVGAYGADSHGLSSGANYVVLGKASGCSSNVASALGTLTAVRASDTTKGSAAW